jgi:hypothetical protein
MDTIRLAGFLIIVGVIVFWIGNIYSPPGVYQESDPDLRLQAVNKHPSRWAVSQGLGGVGIAIIMLGLLLYALQFNLQHGPWLTLLPIGLNIIAVIFVAVWLVGYITDPAPVFAGTGRSWLITSAAALMLVAAVLNGLLYIRSGFPVWIGYLTAGYGALALIALLVARPPDFYVLAIYYFVLIVPAVAMIRG